MSRADFWDHVDKTAPYGCWLWTRCKNPYGYGICSGFSSRLAHRASWELTHGEIPPGMVLDHLCHNPTCVNPSHLRVCTQGENSRNRKANRSNTSGAKGVFWAHWCNRWRVLICLNRKSIHIGYFKDKTEATTAYAQASARFHGEFGLAGGAA